MPRSRGNPPAPSFPWAEFKHAFARAGRYFQYHTVGRVQRLYDKLSSTSWSFTRRPTTRHRARNRRARKKARRAANNNNNGETVPSPLNALHRPTGIPSPNGQTIQSPGARQPPLLPAPPSSRPATPSLSPPPPPPPPSTPSPARYSDNGGAALRSSPAGSLGAQLLFEQAQRAAQPAAAGAAPPPPPLPAPRASHRNARLLAEVDLDNIVYGGRVRRQTEYYR